MVGFFGRLFVAFQEPQGRKIIAVGPEGPKGSRTAAKKPYQREQESSPQDYSS